MSPVEVPTKTLAEVLREAGRLGIKLQGLEEEGGEEDKEEGSEEDSVVVDGDLEGMEEGSGDSDGEEEEEEEEAAVMVVEDVKGDLEAGASQTLSIDY